VLHHRFAPRAHRFVYRIFYFALDLDELPALHRRLRLFSFNRANVFTFRDRDFLPSNEPIHRATNRLPPQSAPESSSPLKTRVLAFFAAHGVTLDADARVQLVTLPRLCGHQFNPVSFYFCFDAGGAPRGAIAEVTNTFREVKAYFIPIARRTDKPAIFQLRVPKHFYVSPFSPVELEFDFTLRAPGGARDPDR
jgi:DUF1365 family protein